MRRILLWFCLTFFLIIPRATHAQIDDSPSSVRATSVAWSPDGTRIAASFADSTVRVWEFNGETELGSPFLTFHPDLTDKVEWTPDSNYLIVQGTHGTKEGLLRFEVTKWDAETGEQVETLLDYRLETLYDFGLYNSDEVPIIGFNSTFTRLAFSMQSRTIALSDRPAIIDVNYGNGIIQQLLWSPDDTRLAVVYDYTIQTFDTESLQLINTIYGPAEYVLDIRWSADSSQLAVIARHSGVTSDNIRIYTINSGNDYLTGLPDKSWSYGNPSYTSLKWHPQNSIAAVASSDGIQIFDLPLGEQDFVLPSITLTEDEAATLDWSPDGQYLVGGLMDGIVQIWKVP